MKVSDLIEQLQKYPPGTEILRKVYYLDGDLPCYYYAPITKNILSEDYVSLGMFGPEQSNHQSGRLILAHYE